MEEQLIKPVSKTKKVEGELPTQARRALGRIELILICTHKLDLATTRETEDSASSSFFHLCPSFHTLSSVKITNHYLRYVTSDQYASFRASKLSTNDEAKVI